MGRVLVVDDNEQVRSLYSEVLELEGHEVFLAEEGRSGVAAAKAEVPLLPVFSESL